MSLLLLLLRVGLGRSLIVGKRLDRNGGRITWRSMEFIPTNIAFSSPVVVLPVVLINDIELLLLIELSWMLLVLLLFSVTTCSFMTMPK